MLSDNRQLVSRLTSNSYFAYGILLVFFLVKLTHINISFFWDESWVYAPALRTMAENGPSLLPDAIPLDYSRGHPLLFHFLGGLWIKIFGSSFSSMHLFALSISVAYLFVCYTLFSKLFTKSIGFWILLLLSIQAMFFAQSSMVLPEMMLAFFSFCAIYFYINKQNLLYILAGILTILTKETGILVILSIVTFDFLHRIVHRVSFKLIFKSGLIAALPLFTLIAHMIYLKYVFGWYLYPEHTGMVKTDLYAILTSFSHVINDQIFIQKRFLISVPFVLIYFINLLRSKSTFQMVFGFTTLLLSGYLFKFHGDQFALSTIFVLFSAHYCISKFIHGNEKEKNLFLFYIFILAYAIFSAANFYTVRYLLSSLVFTLVIPLYYLLTDEDVKKFIPFYLLLTFIVFVLELINPQKINDVNLSYLSYCPAQLEVVKYFESNNLYKEQVNTMFLMSVGLNDKYAGYRSTDDTFEFVNKENNKDADYFIFYNVEANDNRAKLQEDPNSTLIKRIEKNHIWFEIWIQKH